MGAGASIPETLTKDQAKDLAGDKWDEAAFDAVATEGTITAAQLTAAAAPAEGEKKPRKRRLSLVGTENEGKDLSTATRRVSVLAVETDEKVKNASAEEKPAVLYEVMKEEFAKGKDMDSEFASWALSCVSELAQGSPENRAKFVTMGYCPEIVKAMNDVPEDIYVQWQGCHAIGCLCADATAADAFGRGGMEAVLACMMNTGEDVSELGFTGVRAFTQLISNSETNMAEARTDGAKDVLGELKDLFPNSMQFQFSVQKCIDLIEPPAAA
jgi:hypothetical protein